MPNNLEFMFSNIPFFLQNDRNKNILEPIANSFDVVEEVLDALDRSWVLSVAIGENLDNIGSFIGLQRRNFYNQTGVYWELETDSDYKKRLNAYYAGVFYRNNLNSLLEIVKLVSGSYPDNIVQQWKLDISDPNYHLNRVTVESSIDFSIVWSILRSFSSAGTLTLFDVV